MRMLAATSLPDAAHTMTGDLLESRGRAWTKQHSTPRLLTATLVSMRVLKGRQVSTLQIYVDLFVVGVLVGLEGEVFKGNLFPLDSLQRVGLGITLAG